jgi:6-phosphogluconolactonase
MTQTTSSTTRCLSAASAGGAWTRREFLRGAAGLVALQSGVPAAPQFAYVASGGGSVHVFRVRGEVWTLIQRVESSAPACILLSPGEQILYVANAIDEYEGLPRGTVEAFRIDPLSGRLSLLRRIPLSLSATRPRHMALSPDAKLLAVAAYGGGVYNLLPVAKDGSLGQPCGIFKDTGCGPCIPAQASAHPHTLAFDAGGDHLLASDFGSDRINVFAVEDGRMWRRMQRSAGEGIGPGASVLHPSGSFLYVWNGLEGTLVGYRYGAGDLGAPIHRVRFEGLSGGDQGLAVHPSGRTLYTTQPVLTAWRVEVESGLLLDRRKVLPGAATLVTVAPDGESVFVLDGVSGSISRVVVDPATGEPRDKVTMAQVNRPRSLALKTT